MKKIALVTGSNRGIGLATVKELLKRNYRVILTARKKEDGEKALAKLKHLGEVDYHCLDVAEAESVNRMKEFVLSEFGSLDILINNAGINYDTWHNAVNADLDEVQSTINTNLMGAWRMAQAFVPIMKEQGFGRVVNVSSGAGALNNMGGGTPAYGVSKAALNALTIKLASDLKATGILVNSVCPGWVRTDMGGMAAPRSPEKGAETIVWAAELPEGGPTGKFFRDKKEISW